MIMEQAAIKHANSNAWQTVKNVIFVDVEIKLSPQLISNEDTLESSPTTCRLKRLSTMNE